MIAKLIAVRPGVAVVMLALGATLTLALLASLVLLTWYGKSTEALMIIASSLITPTVLALTGARNGNGVINGNTQESYAGRHRTDG